MTQSLAPLIPASADNAGILPLIAMMETHAHLIYARAEIARTRLLCAMTMIHAPMIHVLPDSAYSIR